MRKEKSAKNSITSVISNIVTMLVGFISQAIFIRLLGAEYLGLNGLFTNILTMLSFFELGIGSAIVYHLYKPIAENDVEKIKGLMKFYKKAYTIISGLVFGCGLLVLPFIKSIVGELTVDINIYVIYLLYLINTASSYLLSYKKNIIQADQNGYILNIVHIAYTIILNISQLVILYLTHNYYLYLVIKIICQLLENIVDSIIAKNKYKYLNDLNNAEIDKNIEKDIFKKVKALMFHKVGGSLVNGTDNVIISKFLGVVTVGLYSNYYTIINAVTMLCNQFIHGTLASVGNLIANNESDEKKFNVFNRLRFLNFIFSFIGGIGILVVIKPFISIWVGEKYLLSNLVTFTLVFNFFQKTQRSVYSTFKDSAGIWYEDRYVPLVESAINIISSIVLLKIFGLAGVFMGTIISGLTLWCYSYPKYVYKKLFNRSYLDYAKETLFYILLFIIGSIVTYNISKLIILDSLLLQVVINSVIAIVIPSIMVIIIFRNSSNFKYFLNLIKKILKRIKIVKNI